MHNLMSIRLEAAKNKKGGNILRFLVEQFKPHKVRFFMGLSIKIIGTLMDLVIPWILALIIDELVPTGDMNLILIWGGIMILSAIVSWIGNVTANRIASRVAMDITRKVRYDLFNKVEHLSCKQTDDFTIPSLVSRLTSDTYNVHQSIGMVQRIGIRAPILLIGGLFATLTLDPLLCLVMVATLPFITVVVYFVSKKGVPMYKTVQKKVDVLVRCVRENYQGVRVIKALSKTEQEAEKFDKVNLDVTKSERAAGNIMSITNPAVTLLLNFGIVCVIAVGAYAVDAGISQAGKIIAFMSYFTIISMALLAMTRIFIMYSRASASIQRMEEVFSCENDLDIEKILKEDTDNFIEFKDINFSYNEDKKAKNVLTNINFSIKKGESLGIIGSIASGKSTIIQLLLRFYDPKSGSIRIDGVDIKSLTPSELRKNIGIVFQNDFLMADSIYENIRFERNISKEEIEKAVNYAQAKEFIDSLDEGYEHKLDSKGANFSGGQKQRILIARALASKPDILILDDSSSALDYQTDAKLRKAIKTHLKGTSSIIIAQRISSIQHTDKILVLDKGEIVGYGKHEDLLINCEVYKEILKSQVEEVAE